MKWGLIRSTPRHHQGEKQQHTREEEHEQQGGKGKSKAATFLSFSPLAWLSKLTAKNNAASAKSKPDKNAAATGGFPSCLYKGSGTSTSMSSSAPSQSSSLADTSPADQAAPRRLSVGNDDATEAAAARQLYRRCHYSVGGDRDLQTLRINLIPFSRIASPLPTPATPIVPVLTRTMRPPLPSDTDEEKRPRISRRRRRHGVGGGRRSFSGARVAAAVRVRSPRRIASTAAAVSELERFAVVRRTSDPQREFRASMVEMIASKRIGRPEELESLLACYLSLNADEHHDCIVKVFRQVWFELNPARVAAAPPCS
uniref:Transcription repressor n=1 Tax=Leersia perrieri TaxID=77586 RepID=A0A0D9V5M9_9ORYZ